MESRMAEDKTNQKDAGQRTSGRWITPELAEQFLFLHECTNINPYRLALTLGLKWDDVDKAIERGRRMREHPDRSHPANERPSKLLYDEDDEEAVLRHFGDLCSTLEFAAELLQREAANDVSEQRTALSQISHNQDIIQNKIDKADAWLARRAG
jgi:hypothetical protein